MVFSLSVLFDYEMLNLWLILGAVDLLAHISLSSMASHSYTEISHLMLMKVIRVDYFDMKSKFDDWLFNKYDFTSTGALSSKFYTMEYISRNVLSNVGPINIVLLFFFGTLLLQIVFWHKSCVHFDCTRKTALKVKRCQPQYFLIRFLLTFSLVLGIAAIIPLTDVDGSEDGFSFLETRTQGGSEDDQMLEVYSYFILIIIGLVYAVTLIFSFT